MVKFTLRQLYIPGKQPSVPIGYETVGPTAGLDVEAKRKFPASVSNRTSVVDPLAQSLY